MEKTSAHVFVLLVHKAQLDTFGSVLLIYIELWFLFSSTDWFRNYSLRRYVLYHSDQVIFFLVLNTIIAFISL